MVIMFKIKMSALKQIRPIISHQWIKCNFVTDAKQTEIAHVSSTSTLPVPPTGEAASTTMAQPHTTSVPASEAKLDKTDDVANSPNLFIKLETLDPIPANEAMRKSLSFDEVPGPKTLRNLAKFWSFIPVVGTEVTASAVQYLLSAGKIFGSQLSWGSNNRLFKWLLDEYGPVVRLHGPFGGDVVILSRPEHANAVFQNEGRYPIRSCLDCVEKYRLQFRRYKQAGPFLMYGPEWEKLRKAVEQPLQDTTVQQFDQLEQSCTEFITRTLRIRNKQEEVPPTFNNEIYKWAMECTCSMIINKRLGFLDPCGLSSTSEPARLLEGLRGATEAIRNCETGLHLWKFVQTPAWKSLIKHCDVLDAVLNKYIHKAQESLRQKKLVDTIVPERVSLLESLLVKDGMLPEDVLTILLDMFLIGVNAVSHSVAFLMYHLARAPKAQRNLYNEIKSMPIQMSKGDLTNLKYLQACIKESLRLQPPMPILTRVLSNDIIVHNYRIPKGTYILIATHLSSMREEYFEDAQRFRPERWLEPDFFSEIENLSILPFGHGPRACLAQDLAETEISVLIIKLLQQFKIEYHYGDINSTNRLIAAPNRSLKFRFIDRA